MELDNIDRRILSTLQVTGRMSNAELSEKVNLSPSACHRRVSRLEAEIDAMNANLQPLRSFILPGGTVLAAHMHMCRTVARRAERLTVELATMEAVNTAAVKYLNRLSDWFFVAGRVVNDGGKGDVLWVPGANR